MKIFINAEKLRNIADIEEHLLESTFLPGEEVKINGISGRIISVNNKGILLKVIKDVEN